MVMQKMAFKDAVMLKLKMDGAHWAAELIPTLLPPKKMTGCLKPFGVWPTNAPPA